MGPVAAEADGVEAVFPALEGEAQEIVLNIARAVTDRQVNAGIVEVAVLMLHAVEVEADLHGAESVVE